MKRVMIIMCLCMISAIIIGDDRMPCKSSECYCSTNIGLGPLAMRGQSPFQILRLSLTPEFPATLKKHHFEFKTICTWTNRWAYAENRYTVDMEVVRFSEMIKYAITDWSVVGVEIPFCWRGGGIMDGMIEGFHSTFGFGQMQRTDFPRNRCLMEVFKDNKRYFRDDSGVGMGDIVLSSEIRLSCGTRFIPATSIFAYVKLPTGNDENLYGSTGVDVGGGISIAKGFWRKIFFYSNIAYFHFGSDTILNIKMKDYQISLLLCGEYRVGNKWSILCQYLMNTEATDEIEDFDSPTHELTFGFKREIYDKFVLEFGLIENIINFRNSPDFGWHFGFTVRI